MSFFNFELLEVLLIIVNFCFFTKIYEKLNPSNHLAINKLFQP